ncbi:transposase, MuDR, MULE transposase domain protein [Tanacetum coccineum]
MSEDLTYSSLHEMMMKKFKFESNSQINLSFKLSSFDCNVDITDDDEPDIPETPVYKSKPMISKQYSQQSEVKKGKKFNNKEDLMLAVRLKALNDDKNGVFEMLFIAIGASIRTFRNYLRPVLMIDAAHLKGLYKGKNLVVVAMDGNNQIVPIAFGICKGKTGPCWTWWMSVLIECIGDNLNLLFISDRHAAIALAVENEFP